MQNFKDYIKGYDFFGYRVGLTFGYEKEEKRQGHHE